MVCGKVHFLKDTFFFITRYNLQVVFVRVKREWEAFPQAMSSPIPGAKCLHEIL